MTDCEITLKFDVMVESDYCTAELLQGAIEAVTDVGQVMNLNSVSTPPRRRRRLSEHKQIFLNCEIDGTDMWEVSNTYFQLKETLDSISLYCFTMPATPRVFIGGEEQDAAVNV